MKLYLIRYYVIFYKIQQVIILKLLMTLNKILNIKFKTLMPLNVYNVFQKL